METIINRANNTIDAFDFVKLTQLHKEYDWLEYEPEALFELWCLSDDDDQKNVIEFLIKNFSFIDSKELNKIGYVISNQIERVWNHIPTNTLIVATCDDKKPDGSQYIIQSLKNKFSLNWKETNFINSLPIAAYQVEEYNNIILIDDFIGTGDTITRKYNYLLRILEQRNIKNFTIKIISIASMNFSKPVLDLLKVSYYSYHWLKKGISELIDSENREIAIISMNKLEKKLKNHYNGKNLPNFGYKKSEALFAFEAFNIPNNVFPIFWWPLLKGGILRKTLFKRV